MRLLFPIGSFYPSQSGGPNNTVYWIAKAVAENGHIVKVVTTNDGLDDSHGVKLDEWNDCDKIEVIYTSRRIHYLPIKAFLKSKEALMEVDILHLTSLFFPLSWGIAFLNFFWERKPIIWSIRGELDPKALIYSTWKKKPILWVIKKILASEVIFHATSEEESKYVLNNFGEKTQVVLVPNYLELPKLVEVKKKPYFLYVGRIHPKKAIENLIKGLRLSDSFLKSQFKLLVAGNTDSTYGEELKELVVELDLAEKVNFLGHVEGVKKQMLYAEAYFSFMPSHTENFGNVVIEALAQKTPVVASLGTPWKILNDQKAGFWVDNCPNSLANTIEDILNLSASEYSVFSNNAYKLVKEEFDVRKNINHWIDIYESLISNKT